MRISKHTRLSCRCRAQGGVKAVVWTDVVQAFVMIFSVVTVLTFAVVRVGSVPEVLARAVDGDRLALPP